MKILNSNTITLSLSTEEVREAVVFWLSRSSTKSTTETCALACHLNNNEPKIKFIKNCLILEFKADCEEKEL